MSRQDVAALTVRLGEYNIKQSGETEIFESKAARVVRHKDFTQQTLVSIPRVMSRVCNPVTWQHKDVAIITLADEVPEMDNVRAVCLPSAGSRSVGRSATA